jgi:hypothetical protein
MHERHQLTPQLTQATSTNPPPSAIAQNSGNGNTSAPMVVDHKLTGGAIAVLVFGILLGVMGIIAGTMLLTRYRRRRQLNQDSPPMYSSQDGAEMTDKTTEAKPKGDVLGTETDDSTKSVISLQTTEIPKSETMVTHEIVELSAIPKTPTVPRIQLDISELA